MARILSSLILAFGLVSYMPMSASAHGGDGSRGKHHGKRIGHERSGGKHHGKGMRPKAEVPELDPGAAGTALTLLAGGALVLSARRRRASV